jgi:pimeloyl-ACP methyl ester carboxylesterase
MVKTVNVLDCPHAYELSPPRDSSIVLVFVHGWLLSHRYWQPVIQRLAATYQCLAYDLRGFGASQSSGSVSKRLPGTAPLLPEKTVVGVGATGAKAADLRQPSPLESTAYFQTSYTPAAYAQDLILLLKQLEIRKAWLIGHSLGGSIALWAADQDPDLVAGVTCVNAGGGIYLKEEFERFRAAGQQLVKFRPRWLSYVPFLDLLLTQLNVAQPIARRWGKQRLKDWVAAQPEAALRAMLDSTTEAEVHRLPQVVARLRQPVQFIAGAKDTVMDPKYVHHLASFHASFECCGNNVAEIPNCGHLAMVEQPDTVARKIQSILSTHWDR